MKKLKSEEKPMITQDGPKWISGARMTQSRGKK
jgi:hypothetical protein